MALNISILCSNIFYYIFQHEILIENFINVASTTVTIILWVVLKKYKKPNL